MTGGGRPETLAFAGLSVRFDQRVLRPRPWTVAQSRWAADLLAEAPPGPVLELCAGAGQIGLLAVADTERSLVCVDADPVACEFARQNAVATGLQDRVDVRTGAVDAVLSERERFALVLADPPWVPSHEVIRYPDDPWGAIDGGADGLDTARICVRVAVAHAAPGADLLIQVGTSHQAETVGAMDGIRTVEVRRFPRGVLLRASLR